MKKLIALAVGLAFASYGLALIAGSVANLSTWWAGPTFLYSCFLALLCFVCAFVLVAVSVADATEARK